MSSPEYKSILDIHDLTLGYGDNIILNQLFLRIPEGKVSVIIGPNGSGKSTLLKALSGAISPDSGQVNLHNKNISKLSPKARARSLSLLPQVNTAPDGITVRELVERGRYAYQTWYRQWHKDDQHAVDNALQYTDLSHQAERPMQELSGGQKQRAWLALVLAQNTPLLLLDEPTTYLDIGHQIEVLNVCQNLNKHQGRTIVMVLHDLNLAARYADFMIAMKDGNIIATGTPQDVVVSSIINKLFNLPNLIISDPVSHTPLVVPQLSQAHK
ncbi:MAG: ABC transporter ATP-binding protein [Paraglaciecola sp.]|uniref:ABC transporter ATP-binding protein n=1 Tax=Paraglaciecola sp. TaxID=1920173 RepID=UPI003299B368